MNKKTLVIIGILTLLVVVGMGAWAYFKFPGLNPNARANQNQRNGFNADPAKMPVEMKLAIGTLKLEGTNQAITADEAKTLLPLWKALKSLSTSNTASQDEVKALYQQIEETMTPQQVQSIQKLTWTQSDLQALAQQYGVQFRGGNGGFANLSPDQRATRVAQFRAQNGGQGGDGGGFQGGGGGVFQGGQNRQNGQNVQRTPQPGASGRRELGLNNLFLDPVIKLLEQRAGTGA